MSSRLNEVRRQWRDWKGKKSRATSAAQYVPLSDGQIRLLSIENRKGKLTGQLSNRSLEDAPEYRAVSYAWTHEPLSAVMRCNGEPLHLTHDLLDALTNMSTGLPQGSHFWVDAVCIAQDDAEEKAKQVQQIHEVFRRAHQVLVWLGPRTENSDLEVQKVPTILRILKALPSRTYNSYGDLLAAIAVTRDDKRFWTALFGLCGRRWFCRVWTYQEAFLAKAARLYCGHDICSFFEFTELLYFFYHHGFLYSMLFDFAPGSNLKDLYSRTANLALGCQKRHLEYPLRSALLSCTGRDCTEPVDRVYGILGMVSDFTRASVPVDYTDQSLREYWKVWALAGRLVLQQPGIGMLYMLDHCDRDLVDGNLPTWCPNWASRSQLGPLSSSELKGDERFFFNPKLSLAWLITPVLSLVSGQGHSAISPFRSGTSFALKELSLTRSL